MVILTIGLVALAELLAISLRMQQLGRNETAAIRLAQDKLDQLSVLGFLTAQIQPGGSLTEDQANHFDTPVDADGSTLPYVRRWFIENGPDGDDNRMRQVTIRIIPTRVDARTNATFEMISIIRNNGVVVP